MLAIEIGRRKRVFINSTCRRPIVANAIDPNIEALTAMKRRGIVAAG